MFRRKAAISGKAEKVRFYLHCSGCNNYHKKCENYHKKCNNYYKKSGTIIIKRLTIIIKSGTRQRRM